ncbi:hypothetical protein LPU83_pLPU83c_0704 (plasmid) [Rhizobium favelukesii]|uniref:Uncharacterized protein n=1 Tax=Rhizobium favelukesii TaxID=348824 RepID=W6S4N9_9HYPH|nr:hypothetical protein LPU83_pLPU83c_0704 [Rhizobium favelukesii]
MQTGTGGDTAKTQAPSSEETAARTIPKGTRGNALKTKLVEETVYGIYR